MKFIPVCEPLLDGNEKKYLDKCIETGWISSEGPFVQEFEEKFSRFVNRKFGIAVSNGTAALQVAVDALELPRGSEVIMPAFTIISCAAAIVRAGLKPVLVDADPFTWNMDTKQIKLRITKRTKAIMVVHIYGLPNDMDPILALAKENRLKIIEDFAELIGQTYKDKPCGSFGDISITSFYPNKHIATGEGGMVLTDDSHLAARCRSLRNLCFIPEKRFFHKKLGYNFRLTNLQAALGLAQLERINSFVKKKRWIGKMYNEKLAGFTHINLPLSQTTYAQNIYWVFGIVLSDSVKLSVKQVMERLAKEGIGTRPFFWSMHEQPVFNKMGLFKDEKYPVAERLARRGFYIPNGLTITNNQIDKVVTAVKTVLEDQHA